MYFELQNEAQFSNEREILFCDGGCYKVTDFKK